jgi:hypothetical protein
MPKEYAGRTLSSVILATRADTQVRPYNTTIILATRADIQVRPYNTTIIRRGGPVCPPFKDLCVRPAGWLKRYRFFN